MIKSTVRGKESEMTERRCDTCGFSRETKVDGRFCVRYAPRGCLGGQLVHLDLMRSNDAVWPRVEDDQWCGEWQRKNDVGPEEPIVMTRTEIERRNAEMLTSAPMSGEYSHEG